MSELPNGETEVFAVLGCPVRHSLSPVMHNAAMRALGMNAVYVPFEVRPGRAAEVLKGMAAMGFRGANVTVPLKEEVYAAMDELDDTAKLYGAVNTVSFTASGLRGASTDGVGFVRGYQEAFGESLEARRIMILGAGGAGRSVALACALENAASVTVYNRTASKAESLCEEIQNRAEDVSVSCVSNQDAAIERCRDADVVIQCTSLGLHEGDPSVLPQDAFRSGQCVYDLIYNRNTATLIKAKNAGARVSGGLGMLIHQGVKSFEIWTGQTPSVDVMRGAVEKVMEAC